MVEWLKYVFTILFILYVYRAVVQPLYSRMAGRPAHRRNPAGNADDEGEYVDYEEVN